MHRSFAEEVAAFRAWSDADPVPVAARYGEWECDYDRWPDYLRAVEEHLDSRDPDDLDPAVAADLVFSLARDNETGAVVDALVDRPTWFAALLPHVLGSAERDARWQVAEALGRHDVAGVEREEALLRLVDDEDEYVSRMALGALGEIHSVHAEERCERAWATGHEYQRIMALWVLHRIGSDRLDAYVARAREDGRPYVVAAAERAAAG